MMERSGSTDDIMQTGGGKSRCQPILSMPFPVLSVPLSLTFLSCFPNFTLSRTCDFPPPIAPSLRGVFVLSCEVYLL